MTPRRFGRIKIEKDWRELEEMAATVAPYEGPITRCPMGVARVYQSRTPIVTQPKRAVEPRTDEGLCNARIAANIAKLPELLRPKGVAASIQPKGDRGHISLE